jgi:hypothetical protein
MMSRHCLPPAFFFTGPYVSLSTWHVICSGTKGAPRGPNDHVVRMYNGRLFRLIFTICCPYLISSPGCLHIVCFVPLSFILFLE